MEGKNAVEAKLAASLKKLAVKTPFEKITIKQITDGAGVIRVTFYNHFQDKYDLLEWIMATEILDPVRILFTNKMLKSLLEGVKPNSLFIPMVDNKAEEARFVHSEAHIVNVFDSCEVCWQQYLDPEDYKLRRPARVKAMLEEPKDEFKKTALLL